MNSSIKIGKNAFLLAFVIILALMIVSGILTRVVEPGSYDRVEMDGRIAVVPGSYHAVEVPKVPILRWFTAPVEVLYAPGSLTVIVIILFLVIVGGSFTILEQGDILSTLLRTVAVKMRERRFLLMALLQLFFMVNASVLGVFEAMVPLIVFIVPMAHMFGWDTRTGLGMSLLPLAFGFSAAVTNPFTIGVAQTIAELPLFSGALLRIAFFVLIYSLVFLFVRRHALSVEAAGRSTIGSGKGDTTGAAAGTIDLTAGEPIDPATRRALIWLGINMGSAVLFIIVTARMPALSDLAFPLMALFFLLGGFGAGLMSGLGGRKVAGSFGMGALNMLPGVLLIMMSMSVKHIVDSGGITDTILFRAAAAIENHPPLTAAYLIYGVTLGMNFFIGSASAKAFLMMPILVPLADLVGITRQTAVLAFEFGDGFSNMLYPTNALLLIGLSFTNVSYPAWIRWTVPLQVIILVITALFLWLAVSTGYGPF